MKQIKFNSQFQFDQIFLDWVESLDEINFSLINSIKIKMSDKFKVLHLIKTQSNSTHI